jgi:hypothetical protein
VQYATGYFSGLAGVVSGCGVPKSATAVSLGAAALLPAARAAGAAGSRVGRLRRVHASLALLELGAEPCGLGALGPQLLLERPVALLEGLEIGVRHRRVEHMERGVLENPLHAEHRDDRGRGVLGLGGDSVLVRDHLDLDARIALEADPGDLDLAAVVIIELDGATRAPRDRAVELDVVDLADLGLGVALGGVGAADALGLAHVVDAGHAGVPQLVDGKRRHREPVLVDERGGVVEVGLCCRGRHGISPVGFSLVAGAGFEPAIFRW